MTDATISHLGTVNGGVPATPFDSAKYAEFEELFLSETMTAFASAHVFGNLHYTRTITHGKSARFPATWKATSRYHTPGTPVLGSNRIPANHRTINVDGLLISDVFIDDLEDAMNHYEVRGIYSAELGLALAKAWDQRVAQVIVKAARAAATVTGGFGGSAVTHANAATDSAELVKLVYEGHKIMDEKDIPEERYVAFRPAQYYLVVQDEKVQNTRFGGHGLYMQGKIPFIGSATVVKSNFVPSTNIAATVEGERNDYTGNFTKTVAPMWNRSAVGTVKLKEMTTQMTAPNGDFNAMYQGTLALGKYAVGTGILRPECAVEIAIP